MKRFVKPLRAAIALTAACIFGAPSQSDAAVSLLDQNGNAPGVWDGTTLFIGADTTTTTNWTTSAAGTATTTVFTTGNSMQFGVSNSDFNGVTINITNNFNGNIGANPNLLNIVSTNLTLNFLATSVNARFNRATTVAVTNGSTLNFVGNPSQNWNWNAQQFTFVGNGTVNVSNVLGNNDSTTGGGGITLNMTGGKMVLYQTSLGTFGNGASGSGTGFTLTNGTLVFGSPQSLANVFGAFAAIQTVKLNGGAIDNQTGGAGTVNLNNGSYSIGGNFTYLGSSQDLNLGPAGVTLAVSPAITVNAHTLTMGGVVTDNGSGFGITKLGSGTLALTNASTYSGPTTVSNGTLVVSAASAGNSSYTINDNATLDVSVPTVGQALAMNGLTLGATTGGILQFDVGALGNPTTAPINLGGGTLTINGSGNLISFASLSAITNYPVVIPLVHYGALVGNPATLSLGAFPSSTPPYQGYISNDASGQVIDLVLTGGLLTQPPGNPKPVTWIGSPTGNWDTTTTNWNASGVLTNYADVTLSGAGDPVTFDDSLAGTASVNLTTKLSPASITMNNNSSNYVFTGSGKISGAAVLSLNGTGSLTLDNSTKNDFTGGVSVNAGRLQLGSGDANGNPGSGAITVNGALVFNRTDNALGAGTSLGPISGAGFITNNGSGTITLAGVQPFTGVVVVNAGTLALSGPNAVPTTLSSSAGVIINGGIVQSLGDNVLGNANTTVPITINAGGALTGNGTSGHLGGTLTINGGTLRMDGNQNNTTFGTWDFNGAVVVPGGPITSTISALNVIPQQAGGSTFNITNGTTPSGIDLLVSGSFINGSSTHDTGIVKNGPGVMALDNNNTYTNGTIINGGTLQLGLATDAAALTSPLGWGNVTIASSSVLKFASGKGVTVTNTITDDGSGTLLSSAGTNILGGANSYAGATVVTAGTLALANGGTINSSSLISVNNATLDISTGGTVASSGALSLTNSTFIFGTNIVASLGSVTANNSTLTLPILSSINATVGTFVSAGATNTINVASVLGYPVYPTNLTLIKYSSFANVNGANVLTNLGLKLPTLGSPVGYLTNNTANASIDLVLQSDTLTPIFPITWNGLSGSSVSTNWDILSSLDWVLTSDHATPYGYQDTSAVIFDDSAHGATTVNLTTTVAPGSMIVSNATKSYSFSGPGSITGGVTLVKTNTGTAVFAETGGDNFIGGISVGGGTLVMSNANANITGGLTVNNGSLVLQHSGTIAGGLTVNAGSAILDQTGTVAGNTLINPSGLLQVGNNDAKGALPTGALDNEGALVFNRSDSALNVTTVIAGAGALTNNGTGSVTLGATETMTGPVVANAGTLVLNAGNLASPAGISRASSLTINNGATVTVKTDNSLAGHGATAGILPIFINAGGTLTGDASLVNGASTHIPGLVTLNGGTLASSGTSLQPANGSWDLDNGVATLGGPVTSIISAFDVIPTQVNGTHFTVLAGTTPSGIDLNVTGSLINGTGIHDTGIILDGTGTVAFSGTNTYASALGTTLASGTLIANGPEIPGVSGPLGVSGQIFFTGGTLKYSVLNSFDYSARFGAGGIYNIDTAGQNVTFATALSGGTLTKLGNGTLTLTGANTYGDTVVSRGTLATTTASVGAGSYTVTNGSTLDVLVGAAGAQMPIANLTLGNSGADSATLKIDTLATGNPTAAPVIIAGALTGSGTVNIALSGTALTVGTFPLVTYSGETLSGSLNFVPAAGITGTLTDNHAGLISVTINSVAPPAPTASASITKASVVGTNLVVHGTNNNVPNTNYHYAVLTSTNLMLPLSNWTPVITNTFNPDGTFDYTNPIVPGTARQFIDVQAVP